VSTQLQVVAAIEYQFERVLRRTGLFAGRHITVDFIVNVEAGALSKEERAAATLRRLGRLADGLVGPVRDHDQLSLRFHLTHYVGHAKEISCALARSAVPDVHIIASVGGDGTHGETLSGYEAAGAHAHGKRDLWFVRLPFGTGNDGADAPDLASAIRLLLGSCDERRAGQVLVRPTGMPEFRGFNIASVGLDAYVGYLTNRLKGRFGGDLYKLIADVMTLFYERVVGVGTMRVELFDERGEAEALSGVYLLLAVGVTGHRRYGGGKLVLPGYENFCAIEPLGLVGKIRLKSLFYRGEHVHEPNVTMRSARRIVVHYDREIPLQMDGETVWLEPRHFPLEMTVTPPRVPVLAFAQSKM